MVSLRLPLYLLILVKLCRIKSELLHTTTHDIEANNNLELIGKVTQEKSSKCKWSCFRVFQRPGTSVQKFCEADSECHCFLANRLNWFKDSPQNQLCSYSYDGKICFVFVFMNN